MGAKRPRSPKEASCGRCFRTSHYTAECRHQVVCLSCSGVGHLAVRCKVAKRSPPHKHFHVRSKKMGTDKLGQDVPALKSTLPELQCSHPASRVSISLPLSPEVCATREELAKVVILSIVEGHVNESSILEVAPTLLNVQLAGPITQVNESSFLVPLASRDKVKEVCKLGTFKASTKEGLCQLRVAPWSAELGLEGKASGEGQWMHLWNLPLNGWTWGIISEVIPPVGELVALSQATTMHKRFVSVLVR